MAFGMFALDVVVEIDEVDGTRDSVAVDLAMSLICRCCFMIRCHCGGAINGKKTLQKSRIDQRNEEESRAIRNGDAPSYLSDQLPISCHHLATTHIYLSPTHLSQQETYMHDRQKHPRKQETCR